MPPRQPKRPMRRQPKQESLTVSLQHRSGLNAEVQHTGPPEAIHAHEQMAREVFANSPDTKVRMVRSSTGKQVGFSHIPEKQWRAIFNKKKK